MIFCEAHRAQYILSLMVLPMRRATISFLHEKTKFRKPHIRLDYQLSPITVKTSVVQSRVHLFELLGAASVTGCLPQRFIVVQSLSRVRLFVTLWTAARQASLSLTISWSLLRLMSVESLTLSHHLMLCDSLLLPSAFLSIRVSSSESARHVR